MFTRKKMLIAIAFALAENAAAQTNTKLNPQLKPVTVVATRINSATDEVAATVTSLEQKEIKKSLPADATDLFKDEPDMAVARDLRRFGSTRVNIRAMEDNRVTQMVDGIRLPDFYNSGGPTNFTMNASMGSSLAFLKRVEILRGPASSLYGSDAIGGVVGYLTLDASDLLEPGQSHALQYQATYSSANQAKGNHLIGAWRTETWETLLGFSHTKAAELDNMGNLDLVGNTRTKPNPQETLDRGLLAKFAYFPARGNKLVLAFEARKQDSDVTVARLTSSLPKVSAMSGRDQAQRQRTSLEWEQKPQASFYDRLSARIYSQTSDTHNFNRQTRSNTGASCSAAMGSGNLCEVQQDFYFTQDSFGANVQLESAFKLAAHDHLLTYGVDLLKVNTSELRDALVRNQTTSTSSKSLAGDSFPLRDFAPGHTDTLGLFIQDEISGLADGKLSLSPGLRYDWRKLSPRVDTLAQQVLNAIGRSAVEKTAASLSPKLGALWHLHTDYSAFAQLVSGFRAPNYEEVNGAFRNSVQRYGFSPNPALKPETSTGIELGLKIHTAQVRGQLSYYDNRYHDFIENVRLNCPTDARCISGLTTYLHENIARARIYGVEARSAWDSTSGWKFDAALAWAHGEDHTNRQALNSIEPLRTSLSLRRDMGDWGTQARVRAATAVTRTDDSKGVWFRPAGYAVSDLSLWWQASKQVQLNLAVNNVFNKKYWLWSDIRQADATKPIGVDFYTQAGRNLSLSVNLSL